MQNEKQFVANTILGWVIQFRWVNACKIFDGNDEALAEWRKFNAKWDKNTQRLIAKQ